MKHLYFMASLALGLATQAFSQTCPGVNLAAGAAAAASSSENSGVLGPHHLTDGILAVGNGNYQARWSSGGWGTTSTGPADAHTAWVWVNLGANHNLCEVRLHWETAYAAQFTVQVTSTESSPGVPNDATWTTVQTVDNTATPPTTNNASSPQIISLLGSTAKYVRINCTVRAEIAPGEYAGYSLWEMQVFGSATVAPITLSYFNGKANSNNVSLEWATASESNNDRFEIERSTNGSSYATIANIKAAGNSTTLKKYHLIDNNAAKGNNYYRLKQVDFDGKFTYSPVVTITTESAGTAGLSVYPNPVTDVVNIAAAASETIETVNLYNSSGKQLLQYRNVGKANLSIPLTGFGNGLYVVEVKTGKQTKLYKIIK